MNAKSRTSGHFPNHTQPSNKKKNAKIALAVAIGAMGWQLFAGSSHRAIAQPIFFWDPLGAGGTGSSESAAWSFSPAVADWYNGTALPDVDWNDNTGTSTIADFALTGDTASISGANVGALGLIFGAGGDVVTGTSTLLLGSSGITTAGGTTTISVPITLVANSTFNIGSTLVDSSPISGAGMGFTETNDGTIKLTASNTFTGTTTVNSGTLDLSFGTTGAATQNILAPTSSLALGGGTLLVDMLAKATSPTQTFAGTTLTPAMSAVTITHTASTGTPLINLGSISAPTPGVALVLTGPQTITAGNVTVPSVGKISVGTINGDATTVSSILQFKFDANNAALAGADWATVGLYDFAGVDATGTNVESLTQLGLYTTFNGTTGAITGNADISGTTTTNNGSDTLSSIRFNSSSATSLVVNAGGSAFVRTGGILLTPNVGANNVTISSANNTPGVLTARNPGSATATEMIVYQNNTLGFLNINTGIGNTSGTDTYTQAGAGTVVLGDPLLAAYLGQTYLDGGFTEIPDNNAIGLSSSAAALNLQGGTLVANASFSLDGGSQANARPVNVLVQGGTLAAAGTNTLTVDGAITGTGLLQIGTGLVAGSGAGSANTAQVRGTSGTVILSGGAANTYSGGTLISAGTLQVDGANSNTGTGAVSVSSTTVVVGTSTNTFDGHLTGSGTIATNVTDLAGGHINPGDAGVGTLTMAGLALKANSLLDYDFGTSPSPSNDLIDISTTNGLTMPAAGNTAKVNLFQLGTSTAFDTPGTYDLIQINGGTTLTSATVSADLKVNNPVSPSVATYTFGIDPTNSFVTVTIASLSINAAWNNTGGGNWSAPGLDQTGSDPNWTGGTAPGTTGAGDVATFGPPTSSGGTGINSPSTIDLNTSETVGTINFNNSNSYTISSAEGSILTLDSGSTGAAGITDSLGTHTLAVPTVLNKALNITVTNPTDTLLISGALSGATALNINPTAGGGVGTVILSDPAGNAGYSGSPTVFAGTLQIGTGGSAAGFPVGTAGFGTNTTGVTVNGTLSYDLSTPVTLTNKISGTGTLQQAGTGVLDVNNNNTMSFASIINGTLQLGKIGALGSGSVNIASPGTLDLNDKSPTINALSGNGTIDNVTAGGTPALTIGTAGISTNNNTFNGSILNTTGTVSLVQAGTGTLFLNGASTYGGGTTISAGAIKAGNNSAFGSGPILIGTGVANGLELANGINISNPITPNSGNITNAFEDVPDPGASATLSGPITSNKDVRIGTSQTTSTIVLTGSDVVGVSTSGTILTRGNVVFAANNTFVNNGGVNPLIVGRFTSGPSLNVTIQDNTVVTSNSGVELGGSNSGTTDDTTVTLNLTGNGILNTGTTVNTSTGAGLMDLNNNSKAISSVTVNLGGTSTLATGGFELLSSSGDTTSVNLSGGTIVANGNDPIGGFFPNLSSTLLNGTTLTVQVQAGGGTINNNGFSITIGQALQDGGGGGSDSMTFSGSGTTALTGANTYAGATTVNNGTLLAAAANTLSSSSSVNVVAGTLDVSGSVQSIPSLTISATGALNLGIGNVLTDTGTATFGGTLNVSGTPSGPSVELMSYTSDSGTFANVPTFAGYNLVYGATQLDLVANASGPVNLTWNDAGPNTPSDGQTWDINTNNNWNNGSPGNTVYTEGANVTFDDNNNSGSNPNAYNVTLSTTVNPASVLVNAAGNYSISGTGTIAGTGSLTQSGTGTLTLSTPNTYTGGTIVTAGKLVIGQAGSNAVFTGPALSTANTLTALPTGALTISGNGVVQLADGVTNQTFVTPGAGSSVVTSNINITSLSLTGNGTLDIGNNRIIIDYTTGNDPIASIKQWIANGFSDGEAAGALPAIISSDIAADDDLSGFSYGIGYADGADGLIAGLPSGEIEIMYTLVGDANLDGTVNSEDFTPFSNNLNESGRSWDQGDFNYDGTVNSEDFTPFSHNLNESASLAASETGVLNSPLAVSNDISLTNVPEPASTGFLTLGLVSVLARRRRKGNA